MEIKEEKLQEELQQANISLVIDTYEDIFSDFDPRPFSERALSDDFLLECKRATRDKKEGGFELILSIPKNKRNINDELKIRKRLKEHFRKHVTEKEKELKKVKKEGWTWVAIGTALLIFAAFLENYAKSFMINLLLVISIPAGWFSFWEGLGKIFIHAKEKEPDYEFYKKMHSAQIIFRTY